MADKRTSDLRLESDNRRERELWETLGEIRHPQPSDSLREGFYRELSHAGRPPLIERLQQALGLQAPVGWLTAAAAVLLGIGLGQLGGDGNGSRLAALEHNVTLLNRELIMDRLEHASPGKRLRAVLEAGEVVGDDPAITEALLARATGDRVSSVRSAAIGALGPRLASPPVATQLMSLLENADSPIVQFALVDLVLRYGSQDQHRQLLALASDDRLHPDLQRHVMTTLQGDSV